jgi:ankyrin repeat protein
VRVALMDSWRAPAPGHYNAVSLLLSNGADVSFRDRDGNSVLHRAAINGSVVCLVPHPVCF